MSTFEEALDRWITSPRSSYSYLDAYCVNEACPALNEPVRVKAEVEYGRASWEPDGCEHCGQELEEEPLEVG